MHATTSIIRPLRGIHFPGIYPLRTCGGGTRTDRHVSAKHKSFRSEHDFGNHPPQLVQRPPPPGRGTGTNLHGPEHDDKELRFIGTWEEYPVRNPLTERLKDAHARDSHAVRECAVHATE